MPRERAAALRGLLDARIAVFAAKSEAERQSAQKRLQAREKEYANQLHEGHTTPLQYEILTGGAERDLRVWHRHYPVGGARADVPYDLRLYVKERKLVAEIVPRIIKGRFSRAAGLAAHRARYIVTLIRLALHGSLERLVRCIVCKKFAMREEQDRIPFVATSAPENMMPR